MITDDQIWHGRESAGKNVAEPVPSPDILLAFQCTALPVSVVSLVEPGVKSALTVTAFHLVWSAAPKMVLTLPAKGQMTQLAKRFGHFALNVLAADQAYLADNFADTHKSGDSCDFHSIDWVNRAPGAQPFIAGTVLSAECEILRFVDIDNETTFTALVGDILSGPRPPLLCWKRDYRSPV